MSETAENTLTAYLGPEFQQRLMWQLLVEPEFAEKTIPDLAIEYFDDPNLKRLFVIILEYFKEFDKVPNLQNQSIQQAINKYKTPNNLIEEESLFGVIKRIELWNERIINKQMLHDGDVVQKSTSNFIKQQEYRKLAENILAKTKSGEIKSKFVIAAIEDKFQKITHIGEEEDDCEEVTEGIDKALRKEFRQTIPTGVGVIDALTGGGLGKGEIGVILTPSGVGKTTLLTKIANTSYEQGYNVAQIVFEDTKDQIKRKHYTIWSNSALSRIDDPTENDRVKKISHEKAQSLKGKGRLIIKRFSQENTTMVDVRNWMLAYQKKWGFKFDQLVLDYLDCLEAHKKSPDRTEAELVIIKGFEALASDFDIPAWTAIQSNRSGFDAEYLEAHQSGGSIKRIQKAHFFMSVAKTPEQKEASLANIRILKARFAQDGQTFTDCIFNNDTMEIRIEDSRYANTKAYKGLKHHDETDVNNIEDQAEKLKDKTANVRLHEAISRANGETLNDAKMTDLLSSYQKEFETEPNTEIHPEAEFHEKEILRDAGIENIHINTTRTDISPDERKKLVEFVVDVVNEEETKGTTEGATEGATDDGLLELDETETITDAVSDGVNEGVSEGVNDDLLDFSGDTTTETVTETEVKLEDVEDKTAVEGMKTAHEMLKQPVYTPQISPPIVPPIKNNQSISDIEKHFDDPDKVQDVNRNVHEMLRRERENQRVINKQ